MKDINYEKILYKIEKATNKFSGIMKKRTPFKILISCVLSQRTRDKNTAKASRQLFSKYNTPGKLAKADIKEIKTLIKPSGFYNKKAKRIKQIAKLLVKKYNGKVPKKEKELLELPGVGRKTANIVLSFAFNRPAIAVDTHVHRITNRVGIINTSKPEETENKLKEIIPKKYWINLNPLMVKFGQNLCRPRNPKCNICSIKQYCDYCERNISPNNKT